MNWNFWIEMAKVKQTFPKWIDYTFLKWLFFTLARKKICNSASIKSNKHKLVPRKSVTYLGVSIDETLLWNDHIENVSLKLSRTNGILSKVRHYVSIQLCLSINYYLFYSYLLYGSLVWNFSSVDKLGKIFNLQKKCLRIITFSDYNAHTNPLFIKLDLLKTW